MLATATLAGACNKVPLVAPSGTVITLVSTTNSVPANGSSDIIAVLIENGTTSTGTATTTAVAGAGNAVHNGTLVTFTTTLGRIEPQEARTTNGRANVKLIADGRSGVATITAFSGGASRTLTINVGSAAAARVTVTASPQALPSSGGTTTITARVEDQQGNGIAAVPISFSTTAGTLNQGTVLTDDSGYARVLLQLLAGTTAATVTATAGGGTTGTLTGTVAVTARSRPGLTVSVPATNTAGTPTQITVAVTGTTPVTDVTLDFGDGSAPRSLGPLATSTSLSHTYASSGTYSVTATATEADGTKTTASTDAVVLSVGGSVVGNPNPATIVAFNPVAVTFTFTPTPSTASIDHVDWDFGDGTVQAGQGTQITHVYDSKGTYTVIARVFTPGGASFTRITQQQIN